MIYVFTYLFSIVAANLLVGVYGPDVIIFTSFALIGLDLTLRDKLHNYWENSNLILKMGLLIFAGSVISAALNYNVLNIAIASFVAFAGATIADAVVYHKLKNMEWFIRVNGSNVVSAAVDSIIFPAIAFGLPLMFSIMAMQFIAKTCGGLAWSLILNKLKLLR